MVNVALRVHRLRTRLAWERTSTYALRAGALAAPLWVAGSVGAGLRVGILELAGAAAIGAAWGWRGAPDAVATARRVDAVLGLEDRVLTACTTQDDPSPMAALARRDAAAAWAAAPDAPLAARWPWGPAALVVALLVGASVWRTTMPGGVEGVVTTRRPPDASPAERASTPGSSGGAAPAPSASPSAATATAAATPLRAVPGAAGAGASSPVGTPSVATASPPPGIRGGAGLRLGASGLAGAPGPGTPGRASASEVAAARRATPQLPERYRPVVLRYLAERRP